jgi:hypothetical protein
MAEPVVRKFGSVSGWKGEHTQLTNVNAGGIVGWLNREILPVEKDFTLTSNMNLSELLDQAYRA